MIRRLEMLFILQMKGRRIYRSMEIYLESLSTMDVGRIHIEVYGCINWSCDID
jgi:hypothetical protein